VVLQFPAKVAIDDRLVLALQHLLIQAKAGTITGLAYVAIEADCEYTADVVGPAVRVNHDLALSVALQLAAAVADLAPVLIP
jgi:hypothetical protein